MAPIKFEENIKEKLEKRTLQPSAEAWMTLSKDLNSNDQKNKRGFFFYMSIAASIIGVLLVTTVLFNSSENQLGNPTLVETETNVKASQNKSEATYSNEPSQQDVIVNISEEKKEENTIENVKSSIKNEPKLANISTTSIKKTSKNNVEQSTHDKLTATNETEQAVAALNLETSNEELSAFNKLTFEDSKAMEVVNQIKKLETENGAVSDAEIENLLKQAERDILRERIYNETTRTVSAEALLQDVEEELEQSFRTKVFEGLKSGFKTVKTAVAERNN